MIVRFKRSDESFQKNLQKALDFHFTSEGISRKGNFKMYLKSFLLLTAYILPFVLILSLPLPVFVMWIGCVIMGFAYAGLGMSLMHDACHGSYSKYRIVNQIMGYSMNFLGGNRFNWVIQHNVKHHTFTNIHGADEDLENGNVIRLSPHAEWFRFHRFQHIYSWFLYTLGTLSWVTFKDFKQLVKLHGDPRYADNLTREWVILIISKILYYAYIIVLPAMVLDVPFWYILVGFVTAHMVGGFVLSVTFQLAHVVEGVDHSVSTETPENSWAEHQLRTTSNFARQNRFLTWYMGGLNYQVEHHLFPHICHIHYPKLSPIVAEQAGKMGIPYNEQTGFRKAIRSHYLTLKEYGKRPVMRVA